jgi:hypothetical protein
MSRDRRHDGSYGVGGLRGCIAVGRRGNTNRGFEVVRDDASCSL